MNQLAQIEHGHASVNMNKTTCLQQFPLLTAQTMLTFTKKQTQKLTAGVHSQTHTMLSENKN